MSQPQVVITEIDGALGATPESAGKLLSLTGPATAGPKNTPAAFGRTRDVIGAFTSGPLVEAGCHAIERYGKPVILVRTDATTAGTTGTIDVTGVTGTSVVTATGTPNDDYEIALKVTKGGTIATAGISFQWSADNGRTWSAPVALGTANTYAVPGTGLTLNFAAGTLVAGDLAKTRTTAPAWNAAELGAGLDALAASQLAWDIVEPVGPIDANAFDTLELKLAGMAAAGKYHAWSGSTRMPNVGESEAAYKTALDTIFASKASVYGELWAGACKLTSGVSGRKYRRPVAFVGAAREASASEEVNIADVSLGALVGVSIRDSNGNADEHDESLFPGLDDSRFAVLRTIEGYPGVYVNRPRLFSPTGSDYQLMPHRRVLNLAHAALRNYFTRRLNRPVLVSKTTGFILESEAREIEAGARKAMESVLMAKPKASGVQFTLSRTDNILATKTLTGDGRVIPLGYVEYVNLTVGFYNPALQVQAQAA